MLGFFKLEELNVVVFTVYFSLLLSDIVSSVIIFFTVSSEFAPNIILKLYLLNSRLLKSLSL